jgi:hypothetical protein
VRALLQANRPGERYRALCLSCPDVLATPEELHGLFGRAVRDLPFRADSAAIQAWHKQPQLPGVVDTWEFFDRLGFDLVCVDRVAGRGGEVLFDLNDPVPPPDGAPAEAFDFVFDCVANQVADVYLALARAQAWVRPGGYLVHCLPATMTNQGYYNLNPCLFHDLYDRPGPDPAWALLDYELVRGVYRDHGRSYRSWNRHGFRL